MKRNEIIRIYGTDYTQMTQRVLQEADLAGHIREKNPGLSDPRIGIKPNLVSPTPADYGATTHPEVVEGIIRYLKEHGYHNITICEGSWVGDRTSEAFEYCGYQTLAAKYSVRLLDTQTDSSYPVVCRLPFLDPLTLHLCGCLKEIDFLINVPVLKGHCQTRVTCALKNMKGLIPNSEKRRFHKLGLHRPIACLNTVIQQDFIVVDHICGDPDFEDGGNPLVTNCVMAATDPVLTDAYACRALQCAPDDVKYIKLAEMAGAGCSDLSQALIRTVSMDSLPGQDNPSPPSPEPDLNSPAALLAHKSLQLNYATSEIYSCSACYSALTEALSRLDEEGLLHRLTDELHTTFYIGQGYRGMSGPQDTPPDTSTAIGIGSCTRLFAQNIPGCPPAGDEIYQYLKRIL